MHKKCTFFFGQKQSKNKKMKTFFLEQKIIFVNIKLYDYNFGKSIFRHQRKGIIQ